MTELPSPAVIATGPLTSDTLASAIRQRLGVESLAFYDAIAPIVDFESIDQSVVFRASRYGKDVPLPPTPLPSLREGRGKSFFVPLWGTLLTDPLGGASDGRSGGDSHGPSGKDSYGASGKDCYGPSGKDSHGPSGDESRTGKHSYGSSGDGGPSGWGHPPIRFKHPPPFRGGGPGGWARVRTSIAQ